MLTDIDGRLGTVSGGSDSILSLDFDTKLPLNLNDSDLYPEMKDFPIPRTGNTEMIFVLARYEINNFLKSAQAPTGFKGSWQDLTKSSVALTLKDATIDSLVQSLESKFIQYCDPNIPLHLLTIGLARIACCKMRLAAHHPRNYAGGIAGMPPAEREMLFSTSVAVLEFDSIAQINSRGGRFLWHINNYFLLEGFVYMLSELRYRTSGPDVERAWQLVYDAYTNHPEMASSFRRNPLYAAIGELALKAWEEWQFKLGTFQSNPHAPIPPFIQKLFKERMRQDRNKAIFDSRKGSATEAIQVPPDFINTGEYIKDLESPPTTTPPTPIFPESQIQSWDGTFLPMMADGTYYNITDPDAVTGGVDEIDWMNMNMPFEMDTGPDTDPMRLFDTLPADSQPVDWEFWNSILGPGEGS